MVWKNVEINQYVEKTGWPPLVPVRMEASDPVIWCKLEFLNPSGSTKDRIARYILGKAMREGKVRAGDAVVEASSGSTSIALAMVCAQRGLRFTAFIPEGVSSERILIIKEYGGRVVFTPKAKGMGGAIAAAEEAAKSESAFITRQFENLDNAAAHRYQTAQEIIAQIPGNSVDAVVSGVGTGGTLAGLYLGFRDVGCAVKPFLARPVDSETISDLECCSCFSGRVPGVMDQLSGIMRQVSMEGLRQINVPAERAIEATRRLIRLGFPVGMSSGLNYEAAMEAARQMPGDAAIVTVFPDRMERYFSTELFRQVG